MTRLWTIYIDTVLRNVAGEREIYVPSLLFPKHIWHCIPLNSTDRRRAVSGVTANRMYNWHTRPSADLHAYHLRYTTNKIISKRILSYLHSIIAIYMSVYHLGLQWGWALPLPTEQAYTQTYPINQQTKDRLFKTLSLIPTGTECPHMHGSTQGPVPAAKLAVPLWSLRVPFGPCHLQLPLSM